MVRFKIKCNILDDPHVFTVVITITTVSQGRENSMLKFDLTKHVQSL